MAKIPMSLTNQIGDIIQVINSTNLENSSQGKSQHKKRHRNARDIELRHAQLAKVN